MTTKPKSLLSAVEEGLEVYNYAKRSSNPAPVSEKPRRDLLARMCRETVENAQRGNTDSARAILEDYVRSVGQHSKRSWQGPNHYLYARYIAHAFQCLLDGREAATALGIKTSRPGRRSGTATHDAQAIAAGYWLLIRKGRKPEEAIRLLSGITGADRTTVQDARKAPYTLAFGHTQMISELKLRKIVVRRSWCKKLLKELRSDSAKATDRSNRGNNLGDSRRR